MGRKSMKKAKVYIALALALTLLFSIGFFVTKAFASNEQPINDLMTSDDVWLRDYYYTLDTTNKVVTITKYVGTGNESVTIKPTIELAGVDENNYPRGTYKIALAPSTGSDSIFSQADSMLKTVTIDQNVVMPTSFQGLFQNARYLEVVNMNGVDGTAVTSMEGMFSKCHNLKAVHMEYIDFEACTDMHNMFYECSNIDWVDFKHSKMSAVKNNDLIFWQAKSIRRLSTPHSYGVENNRKAPFNCDSSISTYFYYFYEERDDSSEGNTTKSIRVNNTNVTTDIGLSDQTTNYGTAKGDLLKGKPYAYFDNSLKANADYFRGSYVNFNTMDQEYTYYGSDYSRGIIAKVFNNAYTARYFKGYSIKQNRDFKLDYLNQPFYLYPYAGVLNQSDITSTSISDYINPYYYDYGYIMAPAYYKKYYVGENSGYGNYNSSYISTSWKELDGTNLAGYSSTNDDYRYRLVDMNDEEDRNLVRKYTTMDNDYINPVYSHGQVGSRIANGQYDFVGWNDSFVKNFNTPKDSLTTTKLKAPTSSDRSYLRTIYAVWKNNAYTVNYHYSESDKNDKGETVAPLTYKGEGESTSDNVIIDSKYKYGTNNNFLSSSYARTYGGEDTNFRLPCDKNYKKSTGTTAAGSMGGYAYVSGAVGQDVCDFTKKGYHIKYWYSKNAEGVKTEYPYHNSRNGSYNAGSSTLPTNFAANIDFDYIYAGGSGYTYYDDYYYRDLGTAKDAKNHVLDLYAEWEKTKYSLVYVGKNRQTDTESLYYNYASSYNGYYTYGISNSTVDVDSEFSLLTADQVKGKCSLNTQVTAFSTPFKFEGWSVVDPATDEFKNNKDKYLIEAGKSMKLTDDMINATKRMAKNNSDISNVIFLYGVWSDEFTLRFSSNGYSLVPGTAMEDYQFKADGQPHQLPTCTMKGYGYHVYQWRLPYSEGSSSTTPYSLTASLSFTKQAIENRGNSSVVTIFADWQPNRWYINYYRNYDKDDNTLSATKAEYTYNSQNTSARFLSAPTRNGYKFVKWSTTRSGVDEEIEGKTVTAKSYLATDWPYEYSRITDFEHDKTYTLYAIWEPIQYNINYNVNFPAGSGLTVKSSAACTQRLTYDKSENLTSIDNMVTGFTDGHNNTYSFIGWSKRQDKVPQFDDGKQTLESYKEAPTYNNAQLKDNTLADYLLTDDNLLDKDYTKTAITLYAHYSQTRKITYNLDGGTQGSVIDPTTSIERKNPSTYSVATPNIILIDPVKKGYKFKGWHVGSATGTLLKDNMIVTKEDKDVNLYAEWELEEYTLAFTLNSGSYPTAAPAANEYSKLTKYDTEHNVRIYSPVRPGYDFKGWTVKYASNPDGDPVYSKLGEGEEYIDFGKGEAGSFSFIAQWDASDFTIEFVSNLDGEGGGATYKEKNTKYQTSSTQKLPSLASIGNEVKDFDRPGYTFKGWSVKADGLGTTFADQADVKNILAAYQALSEETKDSLDVKLYAIWQVRNDIHYEIQYHFANTLNSYSEDAAQNVIKTFDNGTTGEEVSVDPAGQTVKDIVTAYETNTNSHYKYTGESFKSGKLENVTKANIDGKGTTVLHLYFSRVFEVKFQKTSTYTSGNGDQTILVPFGETLTDEQMAHLPNYTPAKGYKLKPWDKDSTGEIAVDDEIYKNTTFIAEFELEKYDIIYDIPEGMNKDDLQNDNPETYTIEDEDVTLSALSCRGWEFKGFVNGSGETSKTMPLALKGQTGAKTVKTSWGPAENQTYSVKYVFMKDGEYPDLSSTSTYIKKKTYTEAGTVGDIITYENTKTDTDLAKFVTDMQTANNCKYAVDADNENAKMEIAVQFENDISLIVYFKQQYTVKFSSGAHGTDATHLQAKTPNIESSVVLDYGTPLKDSEDLPQYFALEGYERDGWTSGELPAKVTADATYTAKWKPIEYTISYVSSKDEVKDSMITNTNPVKYTIESNDIVLTNPTATDGWAFDGWQVGASKVSTYTIPKGTTGNKEIGMHWKDATDIPYTIKYHFMVNGTYSSTNVKTKAYTDGTARATRAATADEKDRTKVDLVQAAEEAKQCYYEFDSECEYNNTSVTINPDGSSVIDLYFKQRFKLTFKPGEKAQAGTLAKEMFFDYGQELKDAAPDFKGQTGYEISGWKDEDGLAIPAIAKVSNTFTAQWKPIEYDIVYDYGDSDLSAFYGNISMLNPSKYTIESEFALKEPDRIGYEFLGWIVTGDTQSQPDKQMKVEKGTTGKLYFTARYKAETNKSYTVYHRIQSLDDESTYVMYKIPGTSEPAIFNGKGESGEMISPDIYTIEGFEEPEQTKFFIDPRQYINNFFVLYKRAKYDFTWDLLEGGVVTGQAAVAEDSYTHGMTKYEQPISPLDGECVQRNGYTFTGWDMDIPEIMPAHAVTITAKYDLNVYDLEYDVNGGKLPDDYVKKYTFEDNTDLPAATKQGYVLAGWCQNSDLSDEPIKVLPTKNFGNKKFYAKWECATDTPYTVKHYIQNEDGTGYIDDPKDVDELKGTTDSTVTPEVKTYEGFTSPTAEELVITPDGKAELSYYYTRDKFDVAWDFAGGETADTDYTNGNVYYGIELKKPTVTLRGYEFDKWDPEAYDTVQAENITYTAQYKLKDYNIKYELSGGTDPIVVATGSGATCAAVSAYTMLDEDIMLYELGTSTRSRYVFKGWYFDEEFKNPVGSVAIPSNSVGDITFYAKWEADPNVKYTVEHYKQTLDGDYPEKPNDVETLYAPTDSKVTPASKGYEGFAVPEPKSDYVKADESTVIKYYYKRNKYTINWVYGDTTFSSKVLYNDNVSEPEGVNKVGYNFLGWDKKLVEKMPAENLKYIAIFDVIPTPTPVPTATPEPTNTPEPTATPDPTNTPAPTATPDPTKTPEPTAAPTKTPVPTNKPTSKPTNKPTPTKAPVKPTVKPTLSPSEKLAEEKKLPVTVSKAEKKNNLSMNANVYASQTGKQIDLRWGKVPTATSYDVFAQYCGSKFNGKSDTTVASNVTSVKLTKINGKALDLKKNYKLYITAYKVENGKRVRLAKSITIHIVGSKNKKYTNVKKVKVKKSSYKLSKGKTAKIKAKTYKVYKKKKELSNKHATKFRYATSNSSVATVSKKGVIKAVGKGTCKVYVYARNGCTKAVKVTVK